MNELGSAPPIREFVGELSQLQFYFIFIFLNELARDVSPAESAE